ncbi:MAG: ion transporter, partial [Alphaproteobacteria bacterium]|nr:ion transporter [Alphaproteobacteria bacterium]
ALFHALPGMGAIIAVLLLIYYVAAVLATEVFGHHSDPHMQELFGTIGASMFTLFQLMTLEGWAENIAIPTIALFPWSWAFFVGFIVVTSFAVLNLFIGIIVDAMNIVHEEEHQDEKNAMQKTLHDDSERVHHDIDALRADIAEIKALLRASRG